mmetsp:Transcript_137755/g.274706  ORF Transcript_137755/g.274706 Transcript_137755/m.274706 type:complete len:203 (-) Transcript_137755:100-708(-)
MEFSIGVPVTHQRHAASNAVTAVKIILLSPPVAPFFKHCASSTIIRPHSADKKTESLRALLLYAFFLPVESRASATSYFRASGVTITSVLGVMSWRDGFDLLVQSMSLNIPGLNLVLTSSCQLAFTDGEQTTRVGFGSSTQSESNCIVFPMPISSAKIPPFQPSFFSCSSIHFTPRSWYVFKAKGLFWKVRINPASYNLACS